MARTWMLIGGITGFVMVAAGAFGAHALKSRIDAELLAVFETGTRYGMFHALALLAVGLLALRSPNAAQTVAGAAFTVGLVLFTGSLWALALSGVRMLGAITPLGGLAFLVGWAALVLSVWRLPTGS